MDDVDHDDEAAAQALLEASKLGGHEGTIAKISVLRTHGLGLDPELFDASLQCFVCKAVIEKEPVRCDVCKAILYCSGSCRDTDWSSGVPSTSGDYAASPPHQITCARFTEHMRLAHCIKEHVDLFPWLMLPASGKFSCHMLLAAYGVLGEAKGYWSQPNTRSTHAVNALNKSGKQGAPPTRFHYGCMLHRAAHPTDRDGWRLAIEHVPPLQQLTAADMPPPPEHPLGSWREWCAWRTLPSASIAPMLMEVPLTLYHLIVSQPALMAKPSLTIHMVGVERELSHLPLLGELALLLPHTSIHVVCFGVEGMRAWREAPPHSLARGIDIESSELANAAAELSIASDEGSLPELQPGIRVLLHGLQAKPHLNGIAGTVLGLDESSGRYMVKLDHSSGASMKLKRSNLHGAPRDGSRCGGAQSGGGSTSLVFHYARPLSQDGNAAADTTARQHEVRVSLEHGGATWQEACCLGPGGDARSYSHEHGWPDLLWGANAGVSSYPEWAGVLEACAYLGVPIATTEYCAASHDADAEYVLPLVLASAAAAAASTHGRPTPTLAAGVHRWLNPFRNPGQRQISICNAPDFSNGFVMLIAHGADWGCPVQHCAPSIVAIE